MLVGLGLARGRVHIAHLELEGGAEGARDAPILGHSQQHVGGRRLGEGQRLDGHEALNAPGTLLALVLGLYLDIHFLQQLVIARVAAIELKKIELKNCKK